jgi:hypothetical protein
MMQKQMVRVLLVLRLWQRSQSVTAVGPFSNIKGLTYYRDNEEDPYITLKEVRTYIGAVPSGFLNFMPTGGRQ